MYLLLSRNSKNLECILNLFSPFQFYVFLSSQMIQLSFYIIKFGIAHPYIYHFLCSPFLFAPQTFLSGTFCSPGSFFFRCSFRECWLVVSFLRLGVKYSYKSFQRFFIQIFFFQIFFFLLRHQPSFHSFISNLFLFSTFCLAGLLFYYDLSKCRFLSIHPSWDSLNCLNLNYS